MIQIAARGTAVITGATGGIGAIYADRLARRGHDLILVARDQGRLQRLAQELASSTGRAVGALAADLSQAAELAKVERVLRTRADISMLVNNAGIGATAPLLASDVDNMSRLLALNVEALMRLTYAIVPGFVARGSGAIINIASIVAVAPEVLNGVYAGSKAFVLALSQSLRHELSDKGVRVQVVLPGATATDFWSTAGTPVEHLPNDIVMTAHAMVDAALAGFDQGEFATLPSLPDVESWQAYEAARQALLPGLSLATPARRYAISRPALTVAS